MDETLNNFDDYLERFNLPKEEKNEPDLIYESEDEDNLYNMDIDVLKDEIEEIEKLFAVNYKVRVKAGRLKQFSGPGTNYVYLNMSKKGDILTIIEESSGLGALKWGLIKSTKAWIPLDWCEKLESEK